MMRGIMERIASVDNSKLDGIVEHDELYVRSGMKGRGYHYDIIRERLPRKRGLKPPPGRGTFEKDQPMILCCHQRGGRTVFNVPVNRDPLTSHVCNTVSYGSTVYTDEYLAYRKLKECGFKHDTVCHGILEYARGDIHTTTVNAGPTSSRCGLPSSWVSTSIICISMQRHSSFCTTTENLMIMQSS